MSVSGRPRITVENLQAIGKRLGIDAETVRRRLVAGGFEVPNVDPLSVHDDKIWRMYVMEELSHGEIGVRLGMSRQAVGKRLHRMGVARISRPRRPTVQDETAVEEMRRLYFNEFLDMKEVGRRLGVNRNTVSRWLRRSGFDPGSRDIRAVVVVPPAGVDPWDVLLTWLGQPDLAGRWEYMETVVAVVGAEEAEGECRG